MAIRINRPGAPTNPPQHLFDNNTGITEGVLPRPTPRPGAVPEPDSDHLVEDPHPIDEGHPYAGAPPKDRPPMYLDIRPNPGIHTGQPERKPDNADHGPKYSPG